MNEDVFPIEHGDFPASDVSFPGCKWMDISMLLVKSVESTESKV